MMRFNRRYEHKYKIDILKYYQIKMYLNLYTNKDEFTKISKSGKYLVRSLYFDNNTLDAFHEKENGNWGRIKFRIRSYKGSVQDNDLLSFELKTKKGELMEKYSKFISVEDYKLFMSQKYNVNEHDKLMSEIERLMHVRRWEPKLIVEYDREGFVSKIKDEKVRITFDHNIKFTNSKELFPQFINYQRSSSKEIILEIKCKSKMPIWLLKMIKIYNLKKVANSKYTQGIIATHNDFILTNNIKNITLQSEGNYQPVIEHNTQTSFEGKVPGVDKVIW